MRRNRWRPVRGLPNPRNETARARRALTVAGGVWLACSGLVAGSGLGCGSSSDVVAIAESDLPPSGGVIVVNTPGSQGGMAAPPAPVPVPPPPQLAGSSSDLAPSAAALPSDAVVVRAALRTSPSASAEPWPFTGARLRDVFGTLGPDELVIRIFEDPLEADTYRRLGRPHGLMPGGPAVLVIVDDDFDQYDLLIQEGE